MCQYAYYNDREKIPQLHCKISQLSNDICLYSKFCYKQNKYIHREGVENCYMAIEHNKQNIPNGAFYVRFVRKGYAYVEMGNRVIKIKDTVGVENFAYVRQGYNGYELSLKPFPIVQETVQEVVEETEEVKETETPKIKYNRKKK